MGRFGAGNHELDVIVGSELGYRGVCLKIGGCRWIARDLLPYISGQVFGFFSFDKPWICINCLLSSLLIATRDVGVVIGRTGAGSVEANAARDLGDSTNSRNPGTGS